MNLQRLKFFYHWSRRENYSSDPIEKVYDDISKNNIYDISVDFNKRADTFKKVFKQLSIDKGTLLDLACGTGVIEQALQEYKKLSITGIDISEGMLEVARQRFAGYHNMRFIKSSFMDFKAAASSYDIITIAHATRFIPVGEEKKFVSNIARWLKKDGIFIAIIHNDHYLEPYFKLLSFFNNSWKYNLSMHLKSSLIRHMNSHFDLDKVIQFPSSIIFTEYALIFRKSR